MTASDEVSQIMVGKHRTGIIGLKYILEETAREYSEGPDEVLKAELIRRLSKLNYLPESAKEAYGRAFLIEYKKFTGQAREKEADSDHLEIKILGSGCPCCNQVDQDLMEVMTEMNLAADIEQVTDPDEIENYGVAGTPALLINGKVTSVGAMPPKATIRELLQEALAKQ
jgi:hypothetical protein